MALTPLPEIRGQLASAGLVLVMRRMRVPLIVLIVIFAVSVLGLALVPGVDEQGRPHRLSLFEAFYVTTYTASTIGFGEIPYAFTTEQRMWVTLSIFLAVFGWAYAIGSLLSLMQDTAFRQALARRAFFTSVRRMGEPFLLLVGYGNAAKMLARSLDDMGRRFVVIDREARRVSAVDLDSYTADAPALLGDARDTSRMALAGLGHRHCEGVVALTGDDETNLDVTMTVALLRPDLPVITRSSSRDVAERMRAFAAQEVINPLDRFGDHLRILMRSPAAYQLMMWLTSAPGTRLKARLDPPPRGRWVVAGHGRFGTELTTDLEAEGLEVTQVFVSGGTVRAGDGDSSAVVEAGDVDDAVAFVAATQNDTTNLWLIDAARRANPDAYIVALQNRRANSSLFRAIGVDFGMVPAEVLAHEVLARLANPVLMQFLPRVPRESEAWSATMVERLVSRCGTGAPHLWRVRLDDDDAPAIVGRLADDGILLADLLRDPAHRADPLPALALVLLRPDGTQVMAPEDDMVLHPGDQLLVAGQQRARSSLQLTLTEEATAAYVLEDRFAPASWVWRRLAARRDEQRR